MVTAIPPRNILVIPVLGLAALVLGALVAVQPMLAVGAVGLVAVVALAFLFPVAHLTMLLVVTAIVPYSIQNAYGLGGGTGVVGLLASDVLLFTGLLRATIVLVPRPLDRTRLIAATVTATFLAIAGIQFLHGLASGYQLSEAGTELRTLLGFGAALVALPVLADERARGRLLGSLLAVGFVLGLWGLAQWTLGLSFAAGTGDVGVREGVPLTSEGRGQLQGGMFGFPVVVVLAFAALLSGHMRGGLVRVLTGGVLAMNAVCLLLTFERTFWIVTVLGCGFVALRAGSAQRLRAILLAPLLAVLVLVPLATLSPDTLATARERLLSLGQYGSDSSVDYRLRESGFVSREIEAHPVVGNGLGAAIYWGRPSVGVPPGRETYSHNGYLWIAWKLGVPAAVLLFGAFAWAIARRGAPRGSHMFAAVGIGAQGALLALLVACITFPVVSGLSITATMGVLLAFSALPRQRP